MICGMEALIDSQNLATNDIKNVQVRKVDILPCSESFNNASTPALQIYKFELLRRAVIVGMAGLIDS